MDSVRQTLVAAAERQQVSLAQLSRLLGRNDAYLQQFVRRGSPRILPERDRGFLAEYLGVAEVALGGPPATDVAIPRLAVAASAGPGALGEDRAAGTERFPLGLVRRLARDPGALSLIQARGDSMLPTIADGDDILVDTADRAVAARPAIFVLRLDGTLVVKRLARAGDTVTVTSDNPATPPIAPLSARQADVVGRVVWLGRRLG